MDSQHQIVPFFLRNEGKFAREIQKNAGRWIAETIQSLSSQSERAKSTIYRFRIAIEYRIMPFYYMAVSHKDWELPNSRIWLAEIDIDSGLDFPI